MRGEPTGQLEGFQRRNRHRQPAEQTRCGDADDPPLGIDQRTAGGTRTERRVGSNDGLKHDATARSQRATYRSDDAKAGGKGSRAGSGHREDERSRGRRSRRRRCGAIQPFRAQYGKVGGGITRYERSVMLPAFDCDGDVAIPFHSVVRSQDEVSTDGNAARRAMGTRSDTGDEWGRRLGKRRNFR